MQVRQFQAAILNKRWSEALSLLPAVTDVNEISIAFLTTANLADRNWRYDAYTLMKSLLDTNKVKPTIISSALQIAIQQEDTEFVKFFLETKQVDSESISCAFNMVVAKYYTFDNHHNTSTQIISLLLNTNQVDHAYKVAAFHRAMNNHDKVLAGLLSNSNGVSPSLILDYFASAIEKKDKYLLSCLLNGVDSTWTSLIICQVLEGEAKREDKEETLHFLLDNIEPPSLWRAITKQNNLLRLLLDTIAIDSAYVLTIAFQAIEHKNKEILELLLNDGLDPDLGYENGFYQDTLLCKTVRPGKGCLELAELLLNRKANPDLPNGRFHQTPLSIVVDSYCDHADLIKLLLMKGADPSFPAGKERQTPLHCAISHSNNADISLLLEYGADANQLSSGKTPLFLVTELDLPPQIDESPSAVYSRKKNVDMMNCLLTHNADPNKTTLDVSLQWNVTPLYQVVLSKRYDQIELLLAHGADHTEGVDSYLIAIKLGDLRALEIFFKDKLEKDQPINPTFIKSCREWGRKFGLELGSLVDGELAITASEYASRLRWGCSIYLSERQLAYEKIEKEIKAHEIIRKSTKPLVLLSLFNAHHVEEMIQDNKNKYPDQYPKEEYPELWQKKII